MDGTGASQLKVVSVRFSVRRVNLPIQQLYVQWFAIGHDGIWRTDSVSACQRKAVNREGRGAVNLPIDHRRYYYY
jgi:hypothetical protein